jgi:hypothetical protein
MKSLLLALTLLVGVAVVSTVVLPSVALACDSPGCR